MHIPKGPTAGLELALFEPALQAALLNKLCEDNFKRIWAVSEM